MSNKVSVIIVGINGWDEFTKPCIDSVLKHEPNIDLVVIDNDSEPSYQDAAYIHRVPRVSYAEAINLGMKFAIGDWYLSINNDVICNAPFVNKIDVLNTDAVYGRQIITEKGHIWLGNWLALIPRELVNKMGGFDKNFKKCGFEDADFCIRAMKSGYPTMPIDLPFTHLEGKTRWNDPDYPTVRQENINYFAQKHGFRLGNNMRVTHD
jgi:GT2 family glycosyltransferase